MHILSTIDLLAAAAIENDKAQKNAACKNNAPLISRISRISSTSIHNAEDLDVVMPMYNLFEYSQHYSMTSESLWIYYRYKIDDVGDNTSDSKSFNYQTKTVGKAPE